MHTQIRIHLSKISIKIFICRPCS